MLNRQIILFGIFFVFFVTVVSFGQQPDLPVLIELSGNVGKLSGSVEGLSKTVENLNRTVGDLDKTVEDLNKTVERIDERTKGTAKTVHVILASIIAPIVVAVLIFLGQWLINKNNENKSTSNYTEDPTYELLKELVEKLDVPRLEDVPSRRPSTKRKFLSGDEPINDLKSDEYDTMENV